jgi:hypothetical protein
MSKMKVLSLALVFFSLNLVCFTPTIAGTTTDKESQFAERVKASIAKLGTGPDAHVELKLLDGTKLKGYVAEIAADHFVVADATTGVTTAVPYPQVKKVKGNNLSSGAQIAIVAIVAVVVITLIFGRRD